MKKDAIVILLAVSFAAVVLLGLGFMGGRYRSRMPFRTQIRAWEKALTLGALLKDVKTETASEAAQAYKQDRQNPDALTNYSWAPFNLPAPFVGGAPLPGVQQNAHINRLQFRSDKEIAIPKPEGVLRVFLTGGSTAYSSGASGDDRTIASYLEKDLNTQVGQANGKKIEVFTMATPGWASTHERIVIENLLSELQPDLIISLSGNNDVHWAELGRNVLWFRTYYDAHVFSLVENAYWMTERIKLEDNIVPATSPIDPNVVAQRLIKNVDLITFTLSRTNTPYLFVLQPSLATVSKHLTAREAALLQNRSVQENANAQKAIPEKSAHQDYFRACYQALDSALASAAERGLHYVNLSHVFDAQGNEEIFLDSYHFGDKGNEIVAQAIADQAAQYLTHPPSSSASPAPK